MAEELQVWVLGISIILILRISQTQTSVCHNNILLISIKMILILIKWL